jgi:HK97 family phage portal protein
MSDNYFVRLYNAIINKGYAKQIEKPKEENRGASWNSAGGVNNTFSAQVSMDAFGIHGYTHAGVKRLSQDLAALPLKLIKGYGDQAVQIMDHPVLDLVRMPSTDTDEFLFREQITIDLVLSGNCYILLLGSSDRPVSMVRLHPEEVRIVTDPQKGLVGYEHNSSGSVVMYPPERIIHGKNAGYQKGPQALYGTGAIQPLARELDADLNSQKLVSEATSKGRPDVLLSPKEDGDIWNKEVRRQILDQYAGMQKAGGAMVLSGQVNVDLLQLSPRDMEFQASRTFARESISAVLGVPPSVLGLPTANYATARQAAVEYWSNQIKRGKRIGLLFTRIARLWEDDLHFEHDYTEVEALQSVRNDKLLRVEKHIFFGISPEVAYAAEGLEFPRKQEPKDIGEEEDENVRYLIDVIGQRNLTQEVKGFDSEYLQSIEVVNVPSNPQVQEEDEILKNILGTPANWRDYKQAHLFFNENQDQMKEGYYIRIGRRLDTDDILNAAPEKGSVVVFKDLLDLAVDHLNGRYGRPPITEQERRAAYQVIKQYFDILKMEAPVLLDSYLSFDSKKKDSEDLTNFPKKGDNKKISLRNSNHRTFDPNYAEKLKINYPSIWRAGGNIRGNEQYKKLYPIAKRGGTPKNLTEERAIKLREAWIARHLKDGSQFSDSEHPINLSTIAGIVAQIKWLSIGSIGQSKMKKVINQMKKKIDASKKEQREKKRIWARWVKNSQGKAEKELLRRFKSYLTDAKKRYAKRIEDIDKQEKSLIVDRETFLAIQQERQELNRVVGDTWVKWWMLTGNQQLDDLYRRAGKERPLDLVYGNRDYALQIWNDSVINITRSTGQSIGFFVQRGLENGLSTRAIAESLLQDDQSGIFTLGRANRIARTEATRVVNESTVESYKLLTEQGIQVKKEWLTAEDDRVRDSHRSLDGQTVSANENFKLSSLYGGLETSSPGSFSEVKENINCRCTVIPVLVD